MGWLATAGCGGQKLSEIGERVTRLFATVDCHEKNLVCMDLIADAFEGNSAKEFSNIDWASYFSFAEKCGVGAELKLDRTGLHCHKDALFCSRWTIATRGRQSQQAVKPSSW
jgi:hypothetical protein